MAVQGFKVDIRNATVTDLTINNASQTVTMTVVVPVADVLLTFGKDTRLVRRA